MGEALAEIVLNLTQARNQLLYESQQVAGRGDWVGAKTMMELAERADRLREDVSAHVTQGAPGPKARVPEPSPAAEMEGEHLTRRRPERGGYPRYLVRDDSLIKQGLQRNGREVYEHAVPRQRYDEILSRLGELAAAEKPRPFSIVKVQNPLQCPRYMTYVVVSLLLKEGLLVRARKGTYTFSYPGKFQSYAASLWDQLKGKGADAC